MGNLSEDARKMLIANFNRGVEEMEKLEFELMLASRGGKTRYQLDRMKETVKNGGKVVVNKNGAFVEMQDALLMDSDETISKLIAKDLDEKILSAVERGEMHIDIRVAAEVVHENAVAHGWWEGERDPDEVKALIHSEWSEALEEARAGRPMEWYVCMHGDRICEPELICPIHIKTEECKLRNSKPEGIAVELIDGVIRILDFMAYKFFDKQEEWDEFSDAIKYARGDIRLEYSVDVGKIKVYKLVEILHDYTSLAREGKYSSYFGAVVGAVFEWLKEHGVNPEAVLLRKHRYNTTRPYKHGKKF